MSYNIVFKTEQDNLRDFNGHSVCILRTLDRTESDAEVGTMYAIQFPNGEERHAFADELVIIQPRYDFYDFITGYIEAALWADCLPHVPDHDCPWKRTRPEPLGAPFCSVCDEYGEHETGGREHLELRPGARGRMAHDPVEFIEHNLADLVEARDEHGRDEAHAGHDFWLTRNGHGTGFWDRGMGEVGERLSDAAKVYGEPQYPQDMGDGTADVL